MELPVVTDTVVYAVIYLLSYRLSIIFFVRAIVYSRKNYLCCSEVSWRGTISRTHSHAGTWEREKSDAT